jgi:bacterioferritin (cytochrome b1)
MNNDLFLGMKYNLEKTASVEDVPKAIDYLNNAIEIFDSVNLISLADDITNVLIKIAQEKEFNTIEEMANLNPDNSSLSKDEIELMNIMYAAEILAVKTYTGYAKEFRDIKQNKIADEMELHAKEELGHAEWLSKKLGKNKNNHTLPEPILKTNPSEIIKDLKKAEDEGIANWKKLIQIANGTLKSEAENYLSQEEHHLNDLS